MRIIDLHKIEPFIEMVSEEVTRNCLVREISRPEAYAWVLRELGYFMRLHFGNDGWVSGCVLSLATREEALARTILRPCEASFVSPQLVDDFADELFALASKTAVFGPSPEIVVTALVLSVLDESVDIFVPTPDYGTTHDVSQKWREIGEMNPYDSRHLDHPDQMYLFESESEFRERRTRLLELRSRQRTARLMDIAISDRRFASTRGFFSPRMFRTVPRRARF